MPVRKWEEELRLGKNVRVSPALLAFRLADKVEEQDHHLESVAFAELVGCRKGLGLWQSLIGCEEVPSDEREGEDVVIGSEMDETPCAMGP